jgi:hypothetical protein
MMDKKKRVRDPNPRRSPTNGGRYQSKIDYFARGSDPKFMLVDFAELSMIQIGVSTPS